MFKLVIYLFMVSAECHIRGYSTVWRNGHDKIVKQVVYAPDMRFTYQQPNELQALNSLPAGFIYEEIRINGKSGFLPIKAIDHVDTT